VLQAAVHSGHLTVNSRSFAEALTGIVTLQMSGPRCFQARGAGSAFFTIRIYATAARMIIFCVSGVFGSAGLVSGIGC
jgi:hypothetical protein